MTNGFKIIGISTKTTNKNNQAQRGLIDLWGQFYAQNIFDKIPTIRFQTMFLQFIQTTKVILQTSTQQ